jgi:hypothetical protein
MTESISGAEPPKDVHRRTIIKAAAWSVPAITLIAASPAHATSLDSVLMLTPPQAVLPGANFGPATVQVLDSSGNPWANQPVRVEVVSGDASFGGATFVDGVTDADGLMVANGLVAGSTTGPVTLRATSGPLQDTEQTAVAPTAASLSYTVNPSVGGETTSFTITNTGGTAFVGPITTSTDLYIFPTATAPYSISYSGQTVHALRKLHVSLKKYMSEATLTNVTIPPGATITVQVTWDTDADYNGAVGNVHTLTLYTTTATTLTPVGNEVLDAPAPA